MPPAPICSVTSVVDAEASARSEGQLAGTIAISVARTRSISVTPICLRPAPCASAPTFATSQSHCCVASSSVWNALSDAWLIRRLRLPCLTGVAQASRSGSTGFVLPRLGTFPCDVLFR
jgi:hypothetical protein